MELVGSLSPNLRLLAQVAQQAAETARPSPPTEALSLGSAAVNVAIGAFTSALVTGLFLLGAYFYTRRVERHRRHDEQWTAVGVPVLNAADDLVARIFDIIVRGRPLRMQAPLELRHINVFDPPREISTVWRLLQYLAATAHLERSSFEGGGRTRLDDLRLYIGKARIALKGNVFGSPAPIQTEAQEAMGAKVLSLDPSDFYEFARRLPVDKELQDCVEYVRRIFELPGSLDQVSPSLLTLAHFTIYLIDAIQDLRPTSKWEEFRLLLVSLIRTYNRTTQKPAVYLYHPNDLVVSDYLASYALIAPDRFSSSRRRRRLVRRARSGFPRQLSRDGVQRRYNGNAVMLNLQGTPGDILNSLRAIFH